MAWGLPHMEEISSANNVIRGPWAAPLAVQGFEDANAVAVSGLKRLKANHIGETLITVIPMLFHNIELAGFLLDEDAQEKDTTFIIESIKSLLYKQYGIYHPLHDVVEKVFE